jgi:thioredoxin reductase (NADPH)
MSHHRLIIIGSGPAGLTAAIYAARADLSPLVFEGSEAGGQLMLTTEVENYPGFAEGVMGPQLMETFQEQAERFGAQLVAEDVTEVDLDATPKRIVAASGTYTADAVIIATGANARMLGIPGESRLLGRGVSTCATCDGFFFRDKDVIVVGGGDSAIGEALFLAKFAKEVCIIHRSDSFRASKIMLDRVRAHEKITIRTFERLVEIIGDDRVEAVQVEDVRDGRPYVFGVDGIFVAIGHIPTTQLFEGQLEMDANGYLETKPIGGALTATAIPGVFVCGDVMDSRYRQAATSVGSGCMAAIDAEMWLSH